METYHTLYPFITYINKVLPATQHYQVMQLQSLALEALEERCKHQLLEITMKKQYNHWSLLKSEATALPFLDPLFNR